MLHPTDDPHRGESFRLSTNRFFTEKLCDVASVYLSRRRRRWSVATQRNQAAAAQNVDGRPNTQFQMICSSATDR